MEENGGAVRKETHVHDGLSLNWFSCVYLSTIKNIVDDILSTEINIIYIKKNLPIIV